MYSDDETAKKGAAFLSDVDIIEDWGCGWGGFKTFLLPHQTYVGVDGSVTPAADKIVDLEEYSSEVEGIYLRHVLEHNQGWKNVLANAAKSFTKKLVIVLFTPLQEETQIIQEYKNWNGTGQTMVDIGFAIEDILQYLEGFEVTTETVETPTQYGMETVIYVKRM